MGNLPICMVFTCSSSSLHLLRPLCALVATVQSPTVLIKEWVMQDVTEGGMLLQMEEKHVYIKTDISVS